MKRVVEREVDFCDTCKGGEAWSSRGCRKCGHQFCYECSKTLLIEYPCSVYFSSSRDGRYCQKCDAELRASDDQLHAAYRAVIALRDESKGWSEDFKKRCEAAEDRVKRLTGESE